MRCKSSLAAPSIQRKCNKTLNQIPDGLLNSWPLCPDEAEPADIRCFPCLLCLVLSCSKCRRAAGLVNMSMLCAVYWCNVTGFQWPLCLAAGAVSVWTWAQPAVILETIIGQRGNKCLHRGEKGKRVYMRWNQNFSTDMIDWSSCRCEMFAFLFFSVSSL